MSYATGANVEITPDDLNELVERTAARAAKEAVTQTFVTLGVDISRPLEVQADFRQLREWRQAKENAGGYLLKALITSLVTLAFGYLAWFFMSMKG